MTEETVVNLFWAFVVIFGIREVGTYAQAHLHLTGQPLFRRREAEADERASVSRIHRG